MAPDIIDLTGDDDEAISPTSAAQNALRDFQPRQQKKRKLGRESSDKENRQGQDEGGDWEARRAKAREVERAEAKEARRARAREEARKRYSRGGDADIEILEAEKERLQFRGRVGEYGGIVTGDLSASAAGKTFREQLDEAWKLKNPDLRNAPQAGAVSDAAAAGSSPIPRTLERQQSSSQELPLRASPQVTRIKQIREYHGLGDRGVSGETAAKPLDQLPRAKRQGAPWRPTRYTPADDALLKKLKEDDGLSWRDIFPYFPDRTPGSLQVRYSTSVKGKKIAVRAPAVQLPKERSEPAAKSETFRQPSPPLMEAPPIEASGRPRRRREQAHAPDGFVTWTAVKQKKRALDTPEASNSDADAKPHIAPPTQITTTVSRPSNVSRLLRHRELGGSARYHALEATFVELQNQVSDTLGPKQYYSGTSGDVNCIAWSANGSNFGVGSIAVSDERTRDHNQARNLLYGDMETGIVRELPDHHVERPKDSSSNDGRSSALLQTQDSRLFMTVTNVAFVEDTLYTAGTDANVRVYDSTSKLKHTISHDASVDLLSVNQGHWVASGCHLGTSHSIRVYNCRESPKLLDSMSPGMDTIFPSALRWGSHHRHQYYLLAAFASGSLNENCTAGETRLWDMRSGTANPVELSVQTRNVFDVAWNPLSSSTSTAFAIASVPSNGITKCHQRSVIQCFAPGQTAKRVVEWDCPALDINDVLYCPYDEDLIAASATDGRVYIWDKRFASRSQRPLHTLNHDPTLNVLDHSFDIEAADTGVRFLSWGATRSRLYSGSSDGTVKVWDPYQAPQNAHVKDIATFHSAVMSGSFSPDFRDLLIGEEHGQINLLTVGCEHTSLRAMSPFALESAPNSNSHAHGPRNAARELLKSGQIDYRPMGDLPKRQAVQGSAYSGTTESLRRSEFKATRDALKEAIQEKASMDSPEADANYRRTLAEAEKAEENYKYFKDLQTAAHALQQSFIEREQRSYGQASSCTLDCNYLPQDAGEPVEDSSRSEQRIPSALRKLKQQRHPSTIDFEDVDDLLANDLMFRCTQCTRPAPQPSKGLPLCSKCSAARAGKTASCANCSVAIVPPREGSKALCEVCQFACFRCGQPARVSPRTTIVTCAPCALAWEIGAIGYDVIDESGTLSKGKGTSKTPGHGGGGGRKDLEALGNEEREYYNSLWES